MRSRSVSRAELFQVVGYPLLDLDDDFGIHEVATFGVRYGHLTIWDLQELVNELAGRELPVAGLRGDFQDMLTAEQARAAAEEAGVRLRQIAASRGIPWPERRPCPALSP